MIHQYVAFKRRAEGDRMFWQNAFLLLLLLFNAARDRPSLNSGCFLFPFSLRLRIEILYIPSFISGRTIGRFRPTVRPEMAGQCLRDVPRRGSDVSQLGAPSPLPTVTVL